MKSILLVSFWAATALANQKAGVFDDDDASGSFSFSFAAKFPNDIAVPCSKNELDVISNVVHAIAEIDGIASRIVPSIPELNLAFEQFGEGLLVDHTGQFAVQPKKEEVIEHMTVVDKLEDMHFGDTLDEDGERDETGEDRRLRLLQQDAHTRQQKRSSLRGSPESLELERIRFEEGWEPVWRFGALAEMDRDEGRRSLLVEIDCSTVRDCFARLGYMCVTFCGYKHVPVRRMQEEIESQHPSDDPTVLTSSTPSFSPTVSESGYPTSTSSSSPSVAPSMSPTSAQSESPSAPPSSSPTPVPSISPETLFQEKVAKMEERVTEELTKKLRYLARHEIVPCLGNYWELKVYYKTNLKYSPAQI